MTIRNLQRTNDAITISGARRLITLDESDSRRLCSHLQTMKACQEIWIHYLPGCDASPEGDLDKDGSGENETFDINEVSI